MYIYDFGVSKVIFIEIIYKNMRGEGEMFVQERTQGSLQWKQTSKLCMLKGENGLEEQNLNILFRHTEGSNLEWKHIFGSDVIYELVKTRGVENKITQE